MTAARKTTRATPGAAKAAGFKDNRGSRKFPISRQDYRVGSRLELTNAIRVLAMNAVQQANSSHPGVPIPGRATHVSIYRPIKKILSRR